MKTIDMPMTTNLNSFLHDLGAINNSDDKILGCKLCGQNHKTDACVIIINVTHVYDSKVMSRARLSVPTELKLVVMSDNSTNMISNKSLFKGTRFGPYEATRIHSLLPNINFPLKIFAQIEEDMDLYLDSSNESTCNWMCLVAAASNIEEQNLVCYQMKSDIYYSAIRDIKPGETLKVWYAPYYAHKMGFSVLPQNLIDNELDVKNDLKINQKIAETLPLESLGVTNIKAENWRCKFCNELLSNVVLYSQHLQKHYKDLAMKMFSCKICLKGFVSERYLLSHQKNSHSNVPEEFLRNKKVSLDVAMKLNDESVSSRTTDDYTTEDSGNATSEAMENILEKFKTSELIKNICIQSAKNDMIESNYSNKSLSFVNDILVGGQICDQLENNPLVEQARLLDNNLNALNYNQEMITSSIIDNVSMLSRISDVNDHLKFNLDLSKSSELTDDLNPDSLQDILCDNDMKVSKLGSEKSIVDFNLDFVVNNVNLHEAIEMKLDNTIESTNGGDKDKKSLGSINIDTLKVPPYKCDICLKSFQTIEYLIRHLKKHSGEFTCIKCLTVFCRRENYINHSCNSPETTFNCVYCQKSFNQNKYLNRHVQTHREKYICEHCGKKFVSLSLLSSHNCEEETKEKVKCDICSNLFATNKCLKAHIKQVHQKEKKSESSEPNIEICHVCGEIFKNSNSLKLHLCLHDGKKFKCDLCDKMFNRLDVCKTHMARHQQPQFKCELCNKLLTSKASLNNHIVQQHKEGRKFTCEHCDKVFTQKINLQRHTKQTHSSENVVFACDKCKKSYATHFLLKQHQIEAHSEDKNLNCEYCDKKFARNYLLKRHYLNNHAGRVFSCPYCTTVVKHRASIRRHLDRNHSELRPEWDNLLFINKLGSNNGEHSVKKDNLNTNLPENNKSDDQKMVVQSSQPKDMDVSIMSGINHDQMQINSSVNNQMVFNSQMGFQNLLFQKPEMSTLTHSDVESESTMNISDIEMNSRQILNDPANSFPLSKMFNPSGNLRDDLINGNVQDGAHMNSEKMNFESFLQTADNILDIQSLIGSDATLLNLSNELINDATSLQMEFDSTDHAVLDNMDVVNSKTNEVLSMTGIQDAQTELHLPDSEHEITLGKNAFILDDGTIVQPQDEGNMMFYVLNSEMTQKSIL